MGEHRLTDKEKFCLDAWTVNGQTSLAYVMSRKGECRCSKENLPSHASRWINQRKCKEYIDSRRNVVSARMRRENPSNRSRDQAIDELNDLITATTEPKLKADLLLKLSDLNKWKREEEVEKEKQVKVYIPLSYDRCKELDQLLQRYFAEKGVGK